MAKVHIGNVYPPDDYLLARCAPAGFGLGVKNGFDCTDCNEAILNGTYYLYGEAAVNHPGNSMQYGCLVVHRRGQYITQVIHYDYYEAKRFSKDGGVIWGEWEWANPPLYAGAEYRTTERFRGDPVYIKLVDCAGMPSANSVKAVEHGITFMRHIIDFGGYMMPENLNAISLPYRFSSDNCAYLSVDSKKIQIESGATDVSTYTDVHVWIKYTKSTD